MSEPRSPASNPHRQLIEIAMGLQRSRALAVAVELELAAQLVDGPLEVAELARRTGTHAPSLVRLLRALASLGVFEQIRPGVFGNSPASALLRRDVAGSFWAASRMGATIAFGAWAELAGSIRTGEPAFARVHGKDLWQHLDDDSQAGEIFDEAMRATTTPATPAVTAAYDWTQLPVIADLGGGIGTQLASILDAHPTGRGILIDRPSVLARAIAHPRIEPRAGDLLHGVPPRADGYLLRSVLHDWPDAEAIAILSSVRAVMPADARVLVVEALLAEAAPGMAVWSDLGMLVLTGGRERDAAEYGELFARSGLALDTIVPTRSPFSLLVARAR